MDAKESKSSSFSLIIIPDTQSLAKSYPEVFFNMTRWIVDHANELNIKFIAHVGDLVDRGAEYEYEYENALRALQPIYDADIPLLVAPGNHDYDMRISVLATMPVDPTRSLSMFNKYVGVHMFQDKPWFGGLYEDGKAENTYALFDVDGMSFLILILEYGPRDSVMEWAGEILRKHEDRKAIIITHSYMYMHGERTKAGDEHNPKIYAAIPDANDGEDMWQKYLRHHKNITAVYSGHHVYENLSYRTDKGVHDNTVIQCFQNWQSKENGGGGRIRVVTYDMNENTLKLQVFNPMTNQYETDPGCELSFKIYE